MNAIATIQPSRLPIASSVAKEFDLKPAEWRVLVEQIFPSAKSVEAVIMALAYCQKRGLDIYKKPVHIVPMWSSTLNRMVETVWPGIAEIRTTASRTGNYAGIDAVEYGPAITRTFTGTVGRGNNAEEISKTVTYPEWASVTVYRTLRGQRFAYHAKVFWLETYAVAGKSEVPNDMWAKRPYGQADKCVEAAALRKAFPEELGSTYVAEEMEGKPLDGMIIDQPHVVAPPPPPAAQIAPPVIEQRTGEYFDPEGFLTELEETLATADSEAVLAEVWDQFDVESTLTNDDAAMQRAFDMKAARLKAISA